MLDQNTDRMWYVIGAVLIGAAIIFGMNTLMPETFASVGGMFEGAIEKIHINDVEITPVNLITKYNISFESTYGLDEETGGEQRLWNHAISDYIPVEEGLIYSYTTPKGSSEGEGTWHKRIAYYDKDYNYIVNSGIKNERHTVELISTAPAGAKYARISTDYEQNGVSIGETWFGLYFE